MPLARSCPQGPACHVGVQLHDSTVRTRAGPEGAQWGTVWSFGLSLVLRLSGAPQKAGLTLGVLWGAVEVCTFHRTDLL